MTNAYLSLGLTSVVVAAMLFVRWFLLRGGRRQRAMVVGGDIFTKTFVELSHSPDVPAFAIIGWIAVSAAIGLGAPAFVKMGSYVLDPTELFVTTNYTLFVPLLFGSYVFLIISVGHFEAANRDRRRQNGQLTDPWLTVVEAIFQALFFFAVLWVQREAIHSEIKQPWPCSPWVDPSAFKADLALCANIPGRQPVGSADLSVPGIFYYALRGIDAFIALGLVAVIFSTLYRREKIFGEHRLSEFVFPRLMPTREISYVGTALVACILFGSIVTASNGLALWSLARNADTPEAKRALFFETTWIYWAIITIATSLAAARLVLWLQQRIRNEATGRHEQALAQYTVPLLPLGPSGNDPEQIKRHAEALGRDLAIRLQIGEVFSKAKTWPLPAIAGLAVVIAAGSQAINIGAAIYTAILGK